MHQMKAVWLPRFGLAADETFDSMRMGDQFRKGHDNLSRIKEFKEMFVSKVVQKVSIEVNEENEARVNAHGTTQMHSEAAKVEEFRANQPFNLLY